MGLLRRSRRDDVHVESFLENLHRIAAVATAPIRHVIDLRHGDDIQTAEDGAQGERAEDVADIELGRPPKR